MLLATEGTIDPHKAIDRHERMSRWLGRADQILADERVQSIQVAYGDYMGDDFRFVISVPRVIWAAQLQEEADRIRQTVTETDAALRGYLDALSKHVAA